MIYQYIYIYIHRYVYDFIITLVSMYGIYLRTFALFNGKWRQVPYMNPMGPYQPPNRPKPKFEVHGTLFFGSTSHFLELFPETVVQKDCCERITWIRNGWNGWNSSWERSLISLPKKTLLKMIFFFPDMWVSWRVVDQMNGMDGMDSTFRNERGKTLEIMKLK